MKNYIIFIGGSGARTYKAFIHCAAAGVLETENVSTMIIDADVGNRANTESIALYEKYDKLYDLLSANKNDREVFTCNITMETKKIISPVHSKALTLENAIGNSDENREKLLKCFYTKEEREQSLERGFYAHPNIGCVFFSDFKCQEFKEWLEKIETELNNGEKIKIALVGSIFGGTGAAGIPTIFKLLRDRFEKNDNFRKMHIGAVFLEPYFTILGKNPNKNDISIHTEEFYFNTYEALKYYATTSKAGFDSIYLVGQQSLDIVNDHYVDGGAGQDNKPHVVELYAALALDSFFAQSEMGGVYGAVRKETLRWIDFPKASENGRHNMLKMADFARAQAIFSIEICNYINSRQGAFKKWCGNKGIMVPQWYKGYRLNDSTEKNQVLQIGEYGTLFMEWLYKVNCIYDGEGRLIPDESIKLFGDALRSANEILQSNEKQRRKEMLKEFRDNFNMFVDTTSNVEYVIDKAFSVLSMAGVISGQASVLGAAGLFLKIISLAGKRK